MNTTEMTENNTQDVSSPSNGVGPTGIPPVDNTLSFANENFAADMAKLEAESKGPAIETPATPTMPEQPVEQAPVTTEATAVEVPEKFKTPEGKIDTAKVEKSLASAEDVLAKYLEKEKELKRKMNEVKKAELGLTPEQAANMANIQVSPEFAASFEKDVQTMGLGAAIIRLNAATVKAAEEAAYSRAIKDIEGIKEMAANQTSKQQIEAIGKSDPWVYTEEGVNTLTNLLETQPFLRNAADPYKAAYVFYRGTSNVASQTAPQVLTPTPQARPSAPIPTGQAAVLSNNPVVRLDSREAIEAYLKKLTPAQQSEFFKKLGYPSF